MMSLSATQMQEQLGPVVPVDDDPSRRQYYKTFYGRNLLMNVLGWSVCPWQAFPA